MTLFGRSFCKTYSPTPTQSMDSRFNQHALSLLYWSFENLQECSAPCSNLLQGDCYGLTWLEPLPFSCPLVCLPRWTIFSCLYRACHSKENFLNNNNNKVLKTFLGAFVNLHGLLDYNNFNTKLQIQWRLGDSERLQSNEWKWKKNIHWPSIFNSLDQYLTCLVLLCCLFPCLNFTLIQCSLKLFLQERNHN